ncbi:MAG: hypothetical protein PPP58_09730 [Natronomonas sp.]
MSAQIEPPTERTCELCGRRDVWNETEESWVIAIEDGQRQIGDKHCIHEWDITGQYSPIAGE